jgi:hypothetical protein
MSTAVFPTFVGLKWGVKKSPRWNTRKGRSASGRRYSATNYSSPVWVFTLEYEVLRAAVSFNEIQQLAGFFNSRSGAFDSFYFTDPTDNSVTALACATTVASVAAYTLCKSWGGQFLEPIGAVNGTPQIYLDGVLQSGGSYTISGNVVTFNVAPAAGKVLSWTGSFYYNVAFTKDIADFENFMNQLWSAKSVEMETV